MNGPYPKTEWKHEQPLICLDAIGQPLVDELVSLLRELILIADPKEREAWFEEHKHRPHVQRIFDIKER